ncbi:DotA/TraY family protein [Caballeronia zhejiangensis]|uniref:DotA/TraY family protein n=1 Tax=Caballeronia zhejiangensis TaxID=871203 RepID=UPI001F515AB5|nr:DotA/TraY family protein [Caballeronia zhejiangensis]MCI1041793.1 DotA/TraY family protein [Caballeronia zhejiangensis]
MRPRTRSRAALALLLMLMPLAAWAGNADGSALFTLADNDLSKKLILDALFGDINGSGGSGLSGAIAVFNNIILTVAGVLLAYGIVAGTMQTAHDGEMLGKKWSSMWLPVRLAIGSALMLPAVHGYTVIQAIVLWLAAQGMGAANAVWQAYTQEPVASAAFIAPDTLLAARGLAEKMLLANVCVAAHNAEQANGNAASDADGTPHFTDIPYGVTPVNTAPTATDAGTFGYMYGSTGDEDSPTQCGEVTMQLSATGTSGVSTQSQTINDLINMPAVNGTVQGAMKSGLTAMQTALVPIANQIAQASVAPPPGSMGTKAPAPAVVSSALAAAAQAFSDGVQQSVTNAPDLMNQQVQANIQQDGWLMAGAWFMKISKAGESMSDAMSALPAASGISDGRRNGSGAYDFYIDTSMQLARNLIAQGKAPGSTQAFTGLGAQANADGSVLSTLLNWFIADKNLGALTNPNNANALLGQNPVIGASELGHKLIVTAWGAFEAATTAAGGTGFLAGNFFSEKLGAGEAATLIGMLVSPVFFTLFITLMGAGIALALIPMIPAIMWGMGVLGYLILLIEAVLGSQIWMAAHVHPDGEGLAGRGGQGYMLVLTLMLKPPLMVLGLICSIAIMKPVGYFFAILFMGAAPESGALSGWAGPTLLIALMVMYGALQVQVIRKCFSLIHVIPDQILRWIGHGGSGGGGAMLGEGMDQAAGHAGGAGKMLVGVLPSMNGQALQSGMKKLGEANKKRSLERQAQATERNTDQFRADNNDTRTSNNAAAGEALKNALGGARAPTDDPGTVSAARAKANREGGDAMGGGSTGRNGQGQGTTGDAASTGASPTGGNDGQAGGTTGAKPEAGGATPNEASTGGADRSTLRDPETPGEGGQGQGNDAASALRDALAQYTDSAKNASEGDGSTTPR